MRNREQAARAAENTSFNAPGMCQFVTRTWFDAPSVGDFDGDGASDAEDGWKSEPARAKHTDRHPPRGTPVSYLGGSNDNGHRAISLGNGKIRSTDAGGRGRVATVDLDYPEKNWGLRYAGWSDTMDGILIPMPPAPPAPTPVPRTRGKNVDAAIKYARRAERREPEGTERDRLLELAIATLKKIAFVKRDS